MLYNMCLHLNGVVLATVVAVATVIMLISTVKEKRDERKRA